MDRKLKLIRVTTVPETLGLLKGQLEYMNQYYENIGIASEGEHLHVVARDENIRVIPVQMTRKITPLKDIRAIVQLYRVFKKERPFIVHSMTPKAGLLSMIAAYLARVPHRLHSFTGLIFPYRTGFTQLLLINVDRILCYCATQVYPEGEGVKADLEKFKITSKTLKIIGKGNINGIDLAHFDPTLFGAGQKADLRESLGILPRDFVFVFAGRLVKDKGINELINVFKGIALLHENAKLLLLGDYEKELDPVLPQTETQIKTNKQIIAVGWQKDIRPFLSISNCLVFPSYREGFPNTVIQASAMGLPSIVTNISGSNEIILEGQNGTIIPSKDEISLFEKMKSFIEQEAHFDPIKCRELIATRYKQDYVWQKTLEEYRALVPEETSKSKQSPIHSL
jgi:glycosyltransferase involved in cell wall biosynthesis